MKKSFLFSAWLLMLLPVDLFFFYGCNRPDEGSSERLPYLDPSLPVEQRVDDLMARMTLEEKIGQMCQYVAPEHIRKSREMYRRNHKLKKGDDQYGMYPGLSALDLKEMVKEGKIGSFLHVKDVKEANELQRLAMASRLKVPLIIGIDAIHGHAHIYGATVYPTELALAGTWDTALVRRIARATAEEMRATGMHWTFSPNVEISRDPRWGRTGETFGEDPFLVSVMGVAFTQGYQGKLGPDNVIACAKHFVGGGEPFNGLNAAPLDASVRQLRNLWLRPFHAQVKAGVQTFMAAHNEVSGTPMHKNRFLLTEILRKEWGFDGFVVSDWMDIERIHDLHHAAPTYDEAFIEAIEAGVDMHMHGPGFLESVKKSVMEGRLREEYIDRAVRHILRAKFMLGLFEDPVRDEKQAEKALFTPAHRELALEAARKAIILLKNDGLLPLKSSSRILVTGPNAHNHRLLGDWALQQPEDHVTTVYEGFRQIFGETQVDFINSGESLRHPDDTKMKAPIAKAADYDAVVVVVGSNSLRYDNKEKNCGENIDRAHINLQGNQLRLIQGLYAKNRNTIVVFINGRPLAEPWVKEHIPAILEAWEPGAMGGQAIAEVVKGIVNPSGKLPITIPYDVGQIHMVYNHLPSCYLHHYIDIPSEPLWYFGEGISYTSFSYSDMTVTDRVGRKDTVSVRVTVRNDGGRDGDEIVQVYLRDDYSSATRPVKELIAFRRIHLAKGESTEVSFRIPVQRMGYYNADNHYVVEPGTFTLMAGPSSKDKVLLKAKVEVVQ